MCAMKIIFIPIGKNCVGIVIKLKIHYKLKINHKSSITN